MQLFAILLLTANLVVSVLAAPIIANTTSNVTSPSPSPIIANMTSNVTSYLCGTQTGEGTFYAPALGACGIESSPTQLVAAVSWQLYDTFPGYTPGNPNTNPVCGRKITANYKGKSVEVTVVDRCTGCNETSLDFSPAAFSELADQAIGRLYDMSWTWMS
ncbi:RlpA-like double-psi beta-barrel-protein domain-containing protein-containing protein [Russula emetica]|nr:RlpA-like double-psi beta-barrel-protein domain-containing protein-containing protein [Russula emetica]